MAFISKSRTVFWLSAAVMVLAVLAPALWNRFPFIYPDTGGYLGRPLLGTLELGRSAIYGLFLLPGIALDFWPNIVVQAALSIWLIVLTLRAYGLGGRPLLSLGIVVGLVIASALPWNADTLMPDIFLPCAVLALNLLAFRSSELRTPEVAGLIAVVAFAIASHMSTLVLCLGLIVAMAVAPLLKLSLPRPRLMQPGVAVAAGLLLAPLSNLAIAGQFAFTPGSETFLFGRMVEDGIVARYLADRCPDPSIRLCAFSARMPTTIDDWLWAPGKPLDELGGWRAYQPEARRMVLEMLAAYPGMKAAASVRATIEQLLTVKTEVSLNADYNAPAISALHEMVPQMMPRLLAARQQATPFDLDRLNVLHVTVVAISILALIGVLALAPRLRIAPPLAAFAFTVLVALVGNAAICGTFSATVDRYQSRLAWIAPLALAVAALAARRRDRLGPPRDLP